MDNRAWWIWLQHGLGAGASKQRRILERYGTLQAFYEAGARDWRLEGYFTQKEIARLQRFTPENAAAQLAYAQQLGQQVLTPDMPDYPEKLRQLSNYPCVLYGKGRLPPVDFLLTVAMVGTRKATEDGLHAAHRLSAGMARAGAVIVSGGALGIDTEAHRGALEAGGYTICVLGCSIEYDYLMSNAGLREEIARTGALLSEYPPGTAGMPSNFPVRNRIISGLSDAVVVVEAAARSGSLITAHCALDQGRDVFAVPGSVENVFARGTNALLRDGCAPAICAQDVLGAYETRYKLHVPEEGQAPAVQPQGGRTAPKAAPEDLPADAAQLYRALTREPRPLDELCESAGLPVSRLLAAATELELRGLAAGVSGQRYART